MFVSYIQIRRCASIFGPYLVATCVRDIYPQVWCVLLFRTCVFVDAFFTSSSQVYITCVFSVLFLVLLWFLWLCCAFGGGGCCDIIELTGHLPSNQLSPVSHSRGLSPPGSSSASSVIIHFVVVFIIQKEEYLKRKWNNTLVTVLW